MVTALFDQEISYLEAQIAAFKEAESIATSGLEALSTAVDKVKQQLAPDRISTLKETLKEAILDLFPSDSSIPSTAESSWVISDEFTLWVGDSQKVTVQYHAGEPGNLTHHFEFFGPISETGYNQYQRPNQQPNLLHLYPCNLSVMKKRSHLARKQKQIWD